MKHIKLFGLLVAALFACGDALDYETDDVDLPGYEDEADAADDEAAYDAALGVATQALTVDTGYGQENDGARCFPPWNGGLCRVPLSKTRNVAFACDGDTESQQECLNAKTDALNELHTGTGFDFVIKQINDGSVNAIVKVGTVANNLVSYSPTINHNNDVSNPNGHFEKVTKSTCVVDVNKLKAEFTPTGIYQNPSETIRRGAYYNLYKKGWGLCAVQLGLVAQGTAVMTTGFPSGIKAQFSSAEKTFLKNYKP